MVSCAAESDEAPSKGDAKDCDPDWDDDDEAKDVVFVVDKGPGLLAKSSCACILGRSLLTPPPELSPCPISTAVLSTVSCAVESDEMQEEADAKESDPNRDGDEDASFVVGWLDEGVVRDVSFSACPSLPLGDSPSRGFGGCSRRPRGASGGSESIDVLVTCSWSMSFVLAAHSLAGVDGSAPEEMVGTSSGGDGPVVLILAFLDHRSRFFGNPILRRTQIFVQWSSRDFF
ncbi:hypothetical protein DFH06DRAFT_1243931 [Mycena polygramma]|nr:hypothetical protein DFH06DRAFT_1243931 [Mycena polygramma]